MQKNIFINFNSIKSLLAAVIKRALDDIQGINRDDRFRWEYESACAMIFILSETCKEYCLVLNIDYEALKEKAVKYCTDLNINFETLKEKAKLKKNIVIFNKRGMMLKKIKTIKFKNIVIFNKRGIIQT